MADKDPMERIADAFEKMASALEGIAHNIEKHSESVDHLTAVIGDCSTELSKAIRGEPILGTLEG